jgi:hypothetical protein
MPAVDEITHAEIMSQRLYHRTYDRHEIFEKRDPLLMLFRTASLGSLMIMAGSAALQSRSCDITSQEGKSGSGEPRSQHAALKLTALAS